MRAAITLIPAESRRLIAKAVVQLDEIKRAWDKAYIVLNGGTTNGYVAQELFGMTDLDPRTFTAGTSSHRVLCVTDNSKGYPFPVIFHQGRRSDKTLPQVLQDFHVDTVLIKGANAIDPQGNFGVVAGGFDGGTIGATLRQPPSPRD